MTRPFPGRGARTALALSTLLAVLAAAPLAGPPGDGTGDAVAGRAPLEPVRTRVVTDSTETGGALYVDWGDRRPLVGQRIRVDARFGPAVPGQQVRLEVHDPRTDRWQALATRPARVSPSRVGRAVFRPRVDRSRSLRVAVLPGRTEPALVSAPERVQATGQRAGLSARWSDGRATPQQVLQVRGRAALPVRERVTLQRRTDGRWVRTAATVPGGDGHYLLEVPPTDRGRYRYRLKAVGTSVTGDRVSRVSAVKLVRVTGRWQPGPIPEPGSDPAPEHEPAPQPAPQPESGAAGAGDPTDYAFLSDNRPRWNPCQVIGYRINATLAPASGVADAHAAIARAEEATGLDFVYRGSTDVIPQKVGRDGYPDDTDLVIAWTNHTQTPMLPDRPQTAGVGGFRSISGKVTESGAISWMMTAGTIVLNTQTTWLEPGFGEGKTIGELLMHEIGHVVGLGHARETTQVLYPTMQATAAVWGAGDRSGLRLLGAEQGCLYNRDGSAAEASPGSANAVEVTP